MNSHDKKFSLYFKTRDKAILARGENFNYVTDFPQDLYIYDYKTKTSAPLISYEWFPSQAKYLLNEYNFPVFPEDFAYYLLKDRYENDKKIKKINIPVLVMHGEEDQIVPFKMGKKIFEMAIKPKYSYFT